MDSSLIPLLDGSLGAAGVLACFVILIILGILVPKRYVDKHEERIGFLEKALEIEKRLNDELTSTVSQSNQMIGALRQIAVERVSKGKQRDGISADDKHRDIS